jgi:hypothetical protein
MNPQLIALIIQLVELAIQEEPAIALELHDIFSTPNPSAADWQALREKVLGESFESLAPNAAANLPADPPAPEVTMPAEPAGAASQPKPAPAPEPAITAVAAPKLHPIYGTPV